MQARPKIVRILAVALIVSLVLAACGGGTTGKTWFNLPSVKVNLQPDGTARVFGLNIGYIGLAPAMIQQMQSANIQRLEVRIGYHGILPYVNGQPLPYVAWDQAKVQTIQGILPQMPGVPNAQLIADVLPWLRTIGLGATINLPVASGQPTLNIPRWQGETTVTPARNVQTTIGPITIGSLTFDPAGNAFIEGVPVAVLEQALGMSLPLTIRPDVLAILQGIGAQSVLVKVQPNGIDLNLGNRALPGIVWDAARLTTLTGILPAFVADKATLDLADQVVPLLTGADITLAVSFTGEQTVATELAPIEVNLTEDGTLQMFGIPLAPGAVDPALIASLQGSNVQQLAVSLQPGGLFLAANGETLPSITWTDASLPTVTQVAGILLGQEALLNTVVDLALGIGPNLKINIPPAAGAEALDIPDVVTFEIQPTAADPQGATIRLRLGVDAQGNITQLGGFSADELSQVPIDLPSIDVDAVNRLRDAGIGLVQLDNDPGIFHVRFDGNEVIALVYDQASLLAVLDIATPFAAETLLTDPGLAQILREQLLPYFPTADLDLTFVLE
jgi:hypothetical protein